MKEFYRGARAKMIKLRDTARAERGGRAVRSGAWMRALRRGDRSRGSAYN